MNRIDLDDATPTVRDTHRASVAGYGPSVVAALLAARTRIDDELASIAKSAQLGPLVQVDDTGPTPRPGTLFGRPRVDRADESTPWDENDLTIPDLDKTPIEFKAKPSKGLGRRRGH